MSQAWPCIFGVLHPQQWAAIKTALLVVFSVTKLNSRTTFHVLALFCFLLFISWSFQVFSPLFFLLLPPFLFLSVSVSSYSLIFPWAETTNYCLVSCWLATGRFFFSLFCFLFVFFLPRAARLFWVHEEVEFWRICFPLPPKGWELSGFENRRQNISREVAYFVALKMCW
jgi:hypothetical protein